MKGDTEGHPPKHADMWKGLLTVTVCGQVQAACQGRVGPHHRPTERPSPWCACLSDEPGPRGFR